MSSSVYASGITNFISNIHVLEEDYGILVSSSTSRRPSVGMIVDALEHFMDIVRYANNRRSAGTTVKINSEADVQDAIYFMLKPWIRDLTFESPTEKVAGRYVVEDFRSRVMRCTIEAKYIRDARHGREISKELHDDIEMYSRSKDIDHIVFFIYDPDAQIVDPDDLKAHISRDRSINGRQVQTYILIKP
ncbi:MAG: hypothetical protein JST12_04820 [Armatimonadetes bacterium]|nr:hypothetical protein [Armatimonadota bacterium]